MCERCDDRATAAASLLAGTALAHVLLALLTEPEPEPEPESVKAADLAPRVMFDVVRPSYVLHASSPPIEASFPSYDECVEFIAGAPAGAYRIEKRFIVG